MLNVTKTGTGSQTLRAWGSTYTGVTTLNNGTLALVPGSVTEPALNNGGTASTLGRSGNAASNLVLNAGTLRVITGNATTATPTTTDRLFTLGTGGVTIQNNSTNSDSHLQFTNSGSLAYSGSGNRSLTLAGTNTGNNTLAPVLGDGPGGVASLTKAGAATWILAGNNTYTGATVITSGILQIGNGTNTGSIGSTSSVTNNGTLLYNVGAGNRTLAAAISGNGVFTKNGTGTVTLAGANSYTGSTTVNAGTLLITGNSSLATGAVTVGNTATLGGNGTIGGAVTIQSGGTLAPGLSPGTLTLNGTNLTLASGSTAFMEITGTGTGQFDRVVGINALSLNGTLALSLSGSYVTATWDLFDFNIKSGNFSAVTLSGSYTGSLTRVGDLWSGTISGLDWESDQTNGVLSVIPEPSTWALLAGGLITLAALRRWRQ